MLVNVKLQISIEDTWCGDICASLSADNQVFAVTHICNLPFLIIHVLPITIVCKRECALSRLSEHIQSNNFSAWFWTTFKKIENSSRALIGENVESRGFEHVVIAEIVDGRHF